MKPYNVLMILTDQQRKDSLGCYGNAVTATPNLDRLAQEGIRFNRSYVANPICMPNRLSLFTGMYPRNHGLWTNGLLLKHERETLPGYLAQHGYQTANFGKIHFTPFGGTGGNKESAHYWRQQPDDFDWCGPYWGFERVELTIGHTRPLAHYGHWFRRKGGIPDMLEMHASPNEPQRQENSSAKNPHQQSEKSQTSGPVTKPAGSQSGVRFLPPDLHDSTFVAERTIEFLTETRDRTRPFFVVASFPDPHHPFNPPQEIAQKYPLDQAMPPIGGPEDLASRPPHYRQHFRGGWHRSGAVSEKHPDGVTRENQKERIVYTYAMVDLIDQNIGKILDALEKEGLMDETIILFTSDHGELLGDHGLWFKGPFFYEGLLNVPLIIQARGLLTPRESDALFSCVDIFPTLCELLELPIPEYVNGISQKAQLLDPFKHVRERCLIEYRNGYGRNDCSSKALVTEQFKYVRYQTGECELTDLAEDPQELCNVAERQEYTSVLHQMQSRLLDEILSTEHRGPTQISLA